MKSFTAMMRPLCKETLHHVEYILTDDRQMERGTTGKHHRWSGGMKVTQLKNTNINQTVIPRAYE